MTRKRNNKNKVGSKVEKVSFHYIWTQSTNSTTITTPTVTAIQVSPSLDPRLAALADYWQLYRFVSLKVKINPGVLNSTGTAAIENFSTAGFNPRVPNTAPTTHAEVVELAKSVVNGWRQVTPSILELTRKDLLGDVPLKWYQTIPGTEDTQWEIQGMVYLATNVPSANAVNLLYEVMGEIEFMGRSLNTITPLKRPVPDNCADHNKESDILVVGGVTYKRSIA